MGLTLKEKKAVTAQIVTRYAKAGKNEKTKILDEFVQLTGYNRKYAISVLRKCFKKKTYTYNGKKKESIKFKKPKPKKRVYPHYYDNAVLVSLSRIWTFFNFLCGQRLVPFIRENIDTLAAFENFKITPEVKKKLCKISSATVNRLLKQKRKEYQGKGKSTTKAGNDLSKLIPVRAFFDWDERIPGFFEVDTVSHDGGNASGDYCFTVDVTDVCTGWTELRAVKNKAQRWVKEAIEDVRNTIPYQMKGLDSDNGSEFKNYQLLAWCEQNHIDFTRSRSYKKNDNCFVEQKNDSTVRNIVGYFRYEGDEAVEKLNRLYKNWCLLINFFYPSVKIIAKERKDAHTYKRYDLAKTPFVRTLENDSIPKDVKEALIKKKAELNLIDIKKQVEKDLDDVLSLAQPWVQSES
ncbi:MAG: transposase family protein [Sphaerochaetaceae bacterium]|nr:transposase family protein [Sphaerochaetaceae bacterium]